MKARRTILLSLLSLILVLPSASYAEKWFAVVKAGFSKPKPLADTFVGSLKNSHPVNLGVGYNFNNQISADISLLYHSKFKYLDDTQENGHQYHSVGKVKSLAAVTNIYYNFANFHDQFTPFIGFGVGWVSNNKSNFVVFKDDALFKTEMSKRKNSFMWNAIVGGLFKINDKVQLSAEYRYLNLGNIHTSPEFIYAKTPTVVNEENIYKSKLRVQSFMLGLKYNL